MFFCFMVAVVNFFVYMRTKKNTQRHIANYATKLCLLVIIKTYCLISILNELAFKENCRAKNK